MRPGDVAERRCGDGENSGSDNDRDPENGEVPPRQILAKAGFGSSVSRIDCSTDLVRARNARRGHAGRGYRAADRSRSGSI